MLRTKRKFSATMWTGEKSEADETSLQRPQTIGKVLLRLKDKVFGNGRSFHFGILTVRYGHTEMETVGFGVPTGWKTFWNIPSHLLTTI